MEARSVDSLPRGAEWQYEPKWDGFRCLLIRSGDRVQMQSKSGRDLARYFPEVVVVAKSIGETQFMLDGELVVPAGERFSFDDLLQRIHPAASRIKRLADETPAVFLAFDLLRCDANDLVRLPLTKRRPALERFAKRHFKTEHVFRLSPASRNYADAKRWLASAGGGSDGVIAKTIDLPYQAGNRDGMQKIKRMRSADWQALKPKFVVEVSYDHFTGGRFRHGTTILRWRPDKKPRQCTMEQLQQKSVLPATLLRNR